MVRPESPPCAPPQHAFYDTYVRRLELAQEKYVTKALASALANGITKSLFFFVFGPLMQARGRRARRGCRGQPASETPPATPRRGPGRPPGCRAVAQSLHVSRPPLARAGATLRVANWTRRVLLGRRWAS